MLSEELAFAHALIDGASEIAMAGFVTDVDSWAKVDGSPVTHVDRAVEQYMTEEIRKRYPLDAVIGEEFGLAGQGSRRWIVDPIDGTRQFIRHDPNWRIHLALEVEGEIELAVVGSPALNLRWWAQLGHGAYERDEAAVESGQRRLVVSSPVSAQLVRVACMSDVMPDRLPAGCVRIEPSSLALVELVRGEIDAVVAEGFALWDHAPWILLVEEAGGQFTDRRGEHSGANGGGVYSSATIHRSLVSALTYR
jgi:fructose-1,6-bisphosphatase/inositol monophosphatase family enzyme